MLLPFDPLLCLKKRNPREHLVYTLSYMRIQPSANPVLQNVPSFHFPPAYRPPHPIHILSALLDALMMETVLSLASSFTLASTIPSLLQTAARVPPSIVKTALGHYSEPSGDLPTYRTQNPKSGPRLQGPLGLGTYLFLDNTF